MRAFGSPHKRTAPAQMIRALTAVSIATALLGGASSLAQSTYPSQPIKILVPQPAGAASDVLVRMVAEKMSNGMKQPLVIDNRAGGSGVIAADAVKRAAPDGYTLLVCTSSTSVLVPLINPKVTYDPVNDFVPIGILSRGENIIVVPASSPFKTLRDLIAYAKANSGKLSYGTAGVGTAHHLAGELLQSRTGIEVVHVPYKGTPLAESDLVTGRLDFMINNTTVALPNLKAGKTRALAVTSTMRSVDLPSVPTTAEAGLPDFEIYGWVALCAPAKTPRPVIDRLNAEMKRVMTSPEMKERLQKLGFDGVPTSPEDHASYAKTELERWGRVIREKNLKFE